MIDNFIYNCLKIDSLNEKSWNDIPAIKLVENVNGGECRLNTDVKAVWTDELVCFRFECEDDHIVATYTLRDEPLYNEDVVEIFIDEAGDGHHYHEYEVSPHNVLFDGLVENDLAGGIKLDLEWNAEGIITEVNKADMNKYIYSISIPHAVFIKKPQIGMEWRVNFYRIDDDKAGDRHYSAWSPTGIINFHIPAFFGRFIFV